MGRTRAQKDGQPHDIPSDRRKRAVLYLRVSTPGQMKTDYNPEGYSIPAQRRAVLKKAESLDADVVTEFVEPGRTATTIEKRPVFQEMIGWVKKQKDIDYVIVYHFSRVFRSSVDAAVTKRDLKKVGTRIVSTVLDVGEGPEASMVETIMHAVDQYQSEANGADVKYKMGQKAKNGGTIGRAPIGYLNTVEQFEDRQVRTVVIDPVRGALLRVGFELYATGDWTLADLCEELFERGLVMPRTARYPERPISISRLADVLRDEYYIGWITYEGEKYRGRHEPLISLELFEQVQAILNSRSAADERRRVHHHYLKGSLYCGACREKRGERRRLILQHATNRHGTTYRYFFCTGRYDHVCTLPYLGVVRVEAAIEDHYASLRFDQTFIAEMQEHVRTTVAAEAASARLLHQQLTKQLRELDVKESNLIDLAADGELARDKIRAKLHDITLRRERLTTRLDETNDELGEAARLVEACLELLRNPQELYARCDDAQRRLLNEALFETLYLDEELDGELAVTHRLKEPFAELHGLQQTQAQAATETGDTFSGVTGTDDDESYNDSGTRSLRETGATDDSLGLLLASTWMARGSSRSCMVGAAGFEPATARV